MGIKTDKAKLKALIDKLSAGGELPVSEVEEGGMFYLSSNRAYATSMARPTKKLKDNENFKKAVADADSAQTAVYVDLAAFKAQMGKSMSAKDRADLEALQALGLSASSAGDDYQKGTLRLTAK